MRKWIDLFENEKGPTSLEDVANHFLSIHDDLLDDDEEIDGMDEKTALEIIRREYLSGTCGAFAVALHDKTGFPIVGINGSLHIAVRTPDGMIIDFAGKKSLDEVLKRYGFSKDTSVEPWSREETVEHVRMEIFDERDSDPWDEINIAKWVLNHLGRW